MNTHARLHDLGQSLWLDNITREILDNGTLQALHRRVLGHRADLEPDHLRQGDRQHDAYDDGIRAKAAAGKVRRGAVHRTGARGSAPRRRSVPAGLRRDRRRRRLGVDGSLAAAGERHRGQHRRGRAHPRAGRPAEPVRQDSRHAGRRSGDRGIDLRRRAGQRDAAVLARAVPGRGRSLPARHRAAHRRRPRSARRVGRLAVRQPLGQGGDADKVPAELRNRLGIAIAQRTYRAYRELLASPRWQKLAAPARGRSACSGPAPAPRIPTRPIRSTSRRWPRPTPSTPCPKRRCARSPTTASSRRDGRGRRRCRGGAGALRQGRHRHRRAGDATAARRRAGVREVVAASCWSASPTRAVRSPDAELTAHGEHGHCANRTAFDPLDRSARSGRRSRRIATRSGDGTCASCSPPIPRAASASTAEAAGLYLDYSKNRVTDETAAPAAGARRRLRRCARASTRCSAATRSTRTEHRAVLHVALRAPAGERIVVDGTTSSGRARGARSHGGVRRRACAAANGPATAASASATSSTSASAAPTSGR